MQHIALFGGTFDPVHNGHLQASINIQKYFNFDAYYFLPCKIPAIKPPASANAQQRIDMLQLALKLYPEFKLDLREIERDSPSYMADTLKNIRIEMPDSSIYLIMGYDSLITLNKWHQWEKLITLANLLIINRNGCSPKQLPLAVKKLLNEHSCDNKDDLFKHKAGAIYRFDAGAYDISSTNIRYKLQHHQNVEKDLPKEINEYIHHWKLYQ